MPIIRGKPLNTVRNLLTDVLDTISSPGAKDSDTLWACEEDVRKAADMLADIAERAFKVEQGSIK